MMLAKGHSHILLALATMAAFSDTCAFTPSSTTLLLRSTYKSVSSRSTILLLEPLAKEGPWTAYLDKETTGLVYYFNAETGESMWDPPTASFPQKIKLSKREEEEMSAKRQDYNNKLVASEEATQTVDDTVQNGGGGGMFGSLFAPKEAKVEPIAVEKEPVREEPEPSKVEKKPSLFNGFFGGNTIEKEAKVEYYDQTLFEDAVAAPEEEEYFTEGVAKKSFVADFMASFPATKKADQVVVKTERGTLKIEIASKILPHPEKVSWGGEDALFVSGRSFGVFDGVSGAEKLEGIPLYSNTLAQQLKSEVGTASLSLDDMKRKLLKAAEFADVSATGASTAVIACIGEDDVLRALNVGDSALMVIRNGSIFARTKDIVHYFDCPYQLSEDSPDRPKDGTVLTTKLLQGDVILAGSDGVFDNLDDDAIIQIVSDEKVKSKPGLVAQKIVTESRKVSMDPTAPTPYAKQAKRNNDANYSTGLGGKVDDISCVVVNIS